MTEESLVAAQLENTAAAPAKKGMPKWLKIILGIIAVIVIVVIAVFYLTGDAVKAVDSQLAALRQGNYEEAYNMCSTGFKSATSLETFKGFVERYKPISDNTSSSFNSRKIETTGGMEITSLCGNLTAKDGSQLPVKYQLVKENNEWKILNIDLTGTTCD